jgi:transglutaminase-like putative cysteine protease
MKTPPLLIAAALMLWGWRTGWWALASGLAVAFESSRILKWRWEFTEKEYCRVFDVCTLLFGGATIYLRFSEEITRAGFVLFQWMPVIFALMMLVQAYGTTNRISYRVFSWFKRFSKDKSSDGGINISWAYFCVCLLGAAATNERDPYFYIAVILLCGWAAWSTRVRRYTASVWAGCALFAAIGGWVGQLGWTGLQSALLPLFGEAFARWGPKEFDARQSRTTMGEIGSKKTSGKIVLRVKAEKGRAPQLLRQASYDNFRDTIWSASRKDGFNKIAPENDITTWTLQPDGEGDRTVRISGYLPKRRGLLSLPQGVARVRELPVVTLETTSLGVVRANEGPAVVSYLADFSPGKTFDEDPTALDKVVPEIERPVLDEIAAEIRKTAGTNELEIVQAVEQFFARNFTYSLYHKPNAVREGTILGRFLTKTRTGHCEYFASATTLLLRELGIPARYAVGYSVQESKGDTYLVRERHGHAWTLAWINNEWREIDTTPGSWFHAESEQASFFEPVSDFFSNVWFKFALWRWLGQKGVISRVAPYLVLPLVAILMWRIFFGKKRVDVKTAAAPKFNWPGLDSEYYELEARLAASGHERQPHETPEQWLRRLRKDGLDHPSLPALVDLHYRYRFDPRGLENSDRTRLRQLASVTDSAPEPPRHNAPRQ